MYTELEDEFGDIVGKARRGQEITVEDLARDVDLEAKKIEAIESYTWTPPEAIVEQLAERLGLAAAKLAASAARRYFPLYPAGRPTAGLKVEMLVLGSDFLMNGYVVGCTETGKGAVVDPGFDAEKILKAIEESGLCIETVLLTHGHGDHIGALSEICQATEAPALINKADLPLLKGLANKIDGHIVDGQVLVVGNQRLTARSTPGHTPGGMSLIHEEVAFVGDALFAGSLGGTRQKTAYESQRQAVAERLLGLAGQVTLYPGHGPATTVGEEQQNNPFFD